MLSGLIKQYSLIERKCTVFVEFCSVFFIWCYRIHYPGTESTSAAVKTGKQLWASEDYSTFNDNIGGGCWARVRLVCYSISNIMLLETFAANVLQS